MRTLHVEHSNPGEPRTENPLGALSSPEAPAAIRESSAERPSRLPFDFDRWYEQYRDFVGALVARFIKDPESREDICQNVWTRLTLVGHRYDPSRARETTFIAIITRRAVIDHIRRETRHHQLLRLAPVDGFEESVQGQKQVGDGEDPLANAVFADRRTLVQDRLAKLEPRQRHLLEARFGHNRSLMQLARDLEIPLGTVKSLLWRTMQKLREDLTGRA